MQRINHKRKHSHFLQERQTRQKTVNCPAPDYIQMTTGMLYHFYDFNKAREFIMALKSLFLSDDLFSYTQLKYLNSSNSWTVELTKKQIDIWLGEGAYQKLARMYQYFKNDKSIKLASEFLDIDPLLANQAVLLVYDPEIMFRYLMCRDILPHCKVTDLLQNLSHETVNQAVSFNYWHTSDSCCLNNLLSGVKPELLIQILTKISNDVYETLSDDNDFLTRAILTGSSQIVLHLLNSLKKNTLNRLVSHQSKYNENLLSCAVHHMPSDVVGVLIDKLDDDVCNLITLDVINSKQRTILEKIAVWQPDYIYQQYEKKLTLATKIKTLLPDNMQYTRYGYSRMLPFHNYPGDKPVVKIMSDILQHPNELKKYASERTQLHRIEFFDGGSSFDTWSKISKNIISRAPQLKKRPPECDLSQAIALELQENKKISHAHLDDLTEGWRYLRIQGRTIIFENKNKQLRAIKFQKIHETENDLRKEYITTLYLKNNAHELSLKSNYPTPVCVAKVSGAYKWLEDYLPLKAYEEYIAFTKMIKQGGEGVIYVYDVNPEAGNYFTYLHDPDISENEFEKANRHAVNDLFILLQRGIVFHQLADIFHNLEHVKSRKDAGRYMVLVNILRDFGERGSGRLTGWKEAVRYPNVRASGIADLGDHVSINDYINDSDHITKHYKETQELYGEKAGNYLLANVIAEYQYIFLLIAGRRGCDLTERAKYLNQSDHDIDAIWQKVAKQIIDNCIQATSLLTKQDKNKIEEFFNALISVDRLAKQMQYWMTADYVSDLRHNRIKHGVYEMDTKVSVDIDRFRSKTFNSTIGCSIDGIHQDLGPVNGQDPIKEANKLFYWMITFIFTNYLQLQLTFKDLKTLTHEFNIEESERLRHRLFSHLPEQQYHKMQKILCEERLKQDGISPILKEKITEELSQHQKTHAALVLQNFWRRKKSNTHVEAISHDKEHVKRY